jgi:hypothetical protein
MKREGLTRHIGISNFTGPGGAAASENVIFASPPRASRIARGV